MRERPGESVRLPAIVHTYLRVALRDLTFRALHLYGTGAWGRAGDILNRYLTALGDSTGRDYLIRFEMTGKGTQEAVTIVDEPLDRRRRGLYQHVCRPRGQLTSETGRQQEQPGHP